MALNVDPNKYFKEKRDYEVDIKNFFIKIMDSPPKTIKTYLGNTQKQEIPVLHLYL